MQEFRMCPVGDQAVLCEFGDVIDEGINNRVHCLRNSIMEKNIQGVTEIVPTYRSLLVFYNMSIISYRKLTKIISAIDIEAEADRIEDKKIRVVPCLYGGEYGPDLQEMSNELGMDIEQIINIHQGVDYKIYMLGFLPGFVYLGGLDKRIHMPRLDVPRTKIPARSVGIGGSQTGVYPMESPGGWRLIGSTPLDFYNPKREPPVLCKAGEYIRFVSVTQSDYENIRKDVEKGTYKAEYL
jgi:KipI family sensor histidine kinase inhibitor